MFMRFVQVKIKPELLPQMRKLYDERVIPQLQAFESCLFAGLIVGSSHNDECISLTLWKTQEDAETYERSGVYQKLIEESKPYFAETSEWKVQLTTDLTLAYEPVPEEPVVKSYSIPSERKSGIVPAVNPTQLHVRLVSIKIQPGKRGEFERLYQHDILPALHTVKGCRYAYLMEGVNESNEVISVTIWNSKQDAELYEASGLFDELKDKVKHTFSDLIQWKMKLDKDPHRQTKTSEDLTVEKYRIVSGKSFH